MSTSNPTGTGLLELRARFAPVVEQVARTALRHEVEGTRPHAEVQLLAGAGFGALRVPVDDGGGGVDLAAFFALLVDLAAADPNQAQIWRNHIAFVEDRLQPEPAEQNRHWRGVLAGGAVVGGAWTEPAPPAPEPRRTQLTPRSPSDGRVSRLTGTKLYSTGSTYADWVSVTARRTAPDGDQDVIAVVDARAPGVRLTDDWDGIGQKTTGSGTSVFTDVPVEEVAVFAFGDRAPYQEAVYQLVLLATLAGIARAAQRDAVAALRARRRAYPQGLGEVPRDDPQLQAVIGRVSALASAAEASVLRAAGLLDDAVRLGGERERHVAAVAVYEAQVTVTDDVLRATTLIFDALGSSAVVAGAHLDRHWRNARTVTSHNPRVYKERIVGAWHLNETPPAVYRAS